MSPIATGILKEHGLRATSCREEVLRVFTSRAAALSHSDLEGALSDGFDRVTIYRTLKTFLEKGIVHKVLDDEGMRYALCKEHCSDEGHHHDHVHFKCSSCGKTNCLDNLYVPPVKLPRGYRAEEVNLLIQGRCADCSAAAQG